MAAKPNLSSRREGAQMFTTSIVNRVKQMAPGSRITLTLWNGDGVITDDPVQYLAVASKHCPERTYEISGVDLDTYLGNALIDLKPDKAASARLADLRTEIALALIGRTKKA